LFSSATYNDEAAVAIWLKDSISKLLLGGVEFFVSSDRVAIVGGDRWLNKIEDALKNAQAVLVLCSARSVLRPWVNFEAGGAWITGIRVVPVCHAGMEPTSLPEPLKSLQAYNLFKARDFQDLVELLANQAGLNKPDFDPDKILTDLPRISIEVEPENSSSFGADPQSEQYSEAYGVFWDKELNMRCLSCKKPLKNSSAGPSIFFCSDRGCNVKHVLRNDDGVELVRAAAVSLMRQKSKSQEIPFNIADPLPGILALIVKYHSQEISATPRRIASDLAMDADVILALMWKYHNDQFFTFQNDGKRPELDTPFFLSHKAWEVIKIVKA